MRRKAATWTVRLAASTNVFGQTRAINSSLLTSSPCRSTKTIRSSRARLPRRSGLPHSSKRRCAGSNRKEPKQMARSLPSPFSIRGFAISANSGLLCSMSMAPCLRGRSKSSPLEHCQSSKTASLLSLGHVRASFLFGHDRHVLWLSLSAFPIGHDRPDTREQFRLVDRLGQIATHTVSQRSCPVRFVRKRGNENGRDCRPGAHQPTVKLKPGHSRHLHIRDQAERASDPFGTQEILGPRERFCHEVPRSKKVHHSFADRRVVIDDRDHGFHCRYSLQDQG